IEPETAEVIVSVRDLRPYFRRAAEKLRKHAPEVAHWVVNEVLREARGGDALKLRVTPDELAELVRLVKDGTISLRTAKDVFAEALESEASPAEIVEAKGLAQVSDEGELKAIITQLLEENPDKVDEYRAGKRGLSGFFVGQLMRA